MQDIFLPVAALPQWELSRKVVQLLGLWGPWWCQVCRSYDPIRIFFWASCSRLSEGLFGQSFSIDLPISALRGLPRCGVLLCCSAHQAHRGAPWLGSYSVVHQVFDGPASLTFSCQYWRVGRERLWWWLHPLCVTQRYCLASVAACLPSTGISHHYLPPHIPSVHLSAVNSGPCPGIAAQSLSFSSQPLRLPGDQHSCWVCMAEAKTVWFSFHFGCHRSAVSLSALNVSPLTQTIAPLWGSDPCFSSPTCWA